MKYLSKDPFCSKPSTDSYRKGWEEVFGRCREINGKARAAQAAYERRVYKWLADIYRRGAGLADNAAVAIVATGKRRRKR